MRIKIALTFGWVNDKQVLHKDIALLEQTWKGDEVAELKTNQMSIDSIYIEHAWNCIKHWTSTRQQNRVGIWIAELRKSFRSDYVNRKIN